MGDREHGERRPEGGPARPVPCIWMSAGLVAWKLCDRDLDCEGCPFDDAMRGAARRATAEPPAPAAARPAWEFPEDRRYHPGHTWALEIGAGQARVGVDAFAARLLAHATSVILPPLEARVRQGRVACWLIEGGDLLPLRSPISGTVMRHNPWVRARTAILGASPYEAGWLLELAEVEPRETERLLSAEAMRERAGNDLHRLERQVQRYVSHGRAEVGPTAADGGEKLGDLRAILGSARYRRLVESFLD